MRRFVPVLLAMAFGFGGHSAWARDSCAPGTRRRVADDRLSARNGVNAPGGFTHVDAVCAV
jgi:hypothetical protein